MGCARVTAAISAAMRAASSAPGSLAERMYKPLLRPGWHKIIGFAQRTQGLMVARGNPLGLRSLADLSRSRARYVNRAHGTGTRANDEAEA